MFYIIDTMAENNKHTIFRSCKTLETALKTCAKWNKDFKTRNKGQTSDVWSIVSDQTGTKKKGDFYYADQLSIMKNERVSTGVFVVVFRVKY